MAIEFFHFGNDETYHFFRWVTEGGWHDADALVTKAMERVDEESCPTAGADVSMIARSKLADMLGEILDAILEDLWHGESPGEIGDVGRHPAFLVNPILKRALDQIDLRTVAQAMLIRFRKWAPDRERPEFR